MNKTASKIKDLVKKTNTEKTSFGTDPMEPWSAKYNVNEDAVLDRYLLSRGLNPKYVNKDIKVSHAKSNQFINWKNSHSAELQREAVDKRDVVMFDIPFLIRVLEYAREDAKTDMDLHKVVTKLIQIRNKGVLTMKDYNFVTRLKEHFEIDEVLSEQTDETKKDWEKKAQSRSEIWRRKRLKIDEDKYQDPMAATQTVGSEVDTDALPKRKRELTKSARIIKSIYKKKRVKEELYDHEKEDKGAKFGERPFAAVVLKGGKTMTGTQRDTIEIDPMMRAKTGKAKR